jgi:hypothetical protein
MKDEFLAYSVDVLKRWKNFLVITIAWSIVITISF